MNKKILCTHLLFILAIAFTIIAMFYQISPTIDNIYIEKITHISESNLMTISSFYFLSYAIMQIPNGILIDKFGVSKVLISGITCTILGGVIIIYNLNYYTLVISRLMIGLGCSVSYISSIYLAKNLFKKDKFPLLMGLIEAIGILGYIIAGNCYKLLVDITSYTTIQYIIIGINIVLFFLFFILKKHMAFKKSITNKKQDISIIFDEGSDFFLISDYVAILGYTFFIWMALMMFGGIDGMKYFQHMHSLSIDRSLILTSSFWMGYLIMSLFIGRISISIGSHKKTLLVFTFSTCIFSGVLILPILFSFYTLLFICLFIGASMSGVVIGFVIISEISPKRISGSAIATNNTFLVIGGMVGQLIFPYAINYNLFKSYTSNYISWNYYSGLILFFICTILAYSFLYFGFVLLKNRPFLNFQNIKLSTT